VVRNVLVEEDGRIVARPTGETETIECGLVLRSVGYKGVPLPGVPFDEGRGTIPNDRGRVAGAERTYVAGWIKRGPSGVIGTNKKDATETVELLLEDLRDAPRKGVSADDAERFIAERVPRLVMYRHWTSIDELERAAGEKLGRPRVKLCTWEELLEAAQRVTSGS